MKKIDMSFCLSNHEVISVDEGFYSADDVKTFIKTITHEIYSNINITARQKRNLSKAIRKLAGDKLI